MKNKIISIIRLVYWILKGDPRGKSQKSKRKSFIKKYNSMIMRNMEIEDKEYNELYQKLISGQVHKINLIGDSITAGVGSPSYHTVKDSRIIFDNGKGETYRESTYTIQAWCNYFRYYIKQNFPDAEFVNSGIGGKSAKWVNANKEHLISDKEDVVFFMLGTNDRWDCESLTEYKTNLEQLLEYVNERTNLMYVMSPPPALTDNQFPFGVKEINDVIKEVCLKHNYKFLSHYENLLAYSKNKNIDLSELLQSTGSHPIQKGYDEMWLFLSRKLGLFN